MDSDVGRRIDAKRAKTFDEFKWADPNDPKIFWGTGLGTTIVKRTVDLLKAAT